MAGWLHASHLSHLGIANTMRLAHAYNRIKFYRQDRWRRSMYRNELPALLQENGAPTRPTLQLGDGWVIDTSMSLPHLDRMLEESEKIIAERSGARLSGDSYRSYFQDVWKTEDLVEYPSFLDFVTSSDVLATVADHLQCIPTLSPTLPSGIRFVESNAAFDDQPGASQGTSRSTSLVIIPPQLLYYSSGAGLPPPTPPFLPPSPPPLRKSQVLGYWRRGKGYRVTDHEIYSAVDRKEAIEFCYPRGTVCSSILRLASITAAVTPLSRDSNSWSDTAAPAGRTSAKRFCSLRFTQVAPQILAENGAQQHAGGLCRIIDRKRKTRTLSPAPN